MYLSQCIIKIFDQITYFFVGFSQYLSKYPISVFFLVIILSILTFNSLKYILIRIEKRRGDPYKSCEFYVQVNSYQGCRHWRYRKQFNATKSCSGCKGKSVEIPYDELERRVSNSAFWKRIILFLANSGTAALPYLTFSFTLIMTIVGTST